MTKKGNNRWVHFGWKITTRLRGYGCSIDFLTNSTQEQIWKYKATKGQNFDGMEIFSDTLDGIKESICEYEDAYA